MIFRQDSSSIFKTFETQESASKTHSLEASGSDAPDESTSIEEIKTVLRYQKLNRAQRGDSISTKLLQSKGNYSPNLLHHPILKQTKFDLV